MNEDFYYNIPPQIRRDPNLLAGYLLNMQVGNTQGQNISQTNTITLTPEQLQNTAMTEEEMQPFTDPETLDRMRDNRRVASQGQGTGEFQFFNPYMGVDIPSASYLFGQSLGSGNTGMAIASGLKTGLGLGRNILSGLGYAKQREKLMDEYYENQRRTVTQENNPTYYQDGGQQIPQDSESQQQGEQQVQQVLQAIAGALSQGVNPSEVLQELVSMGIPEQEATQMIEFVMQQMTQQQQVSNQQIQQPQQPQQQEPMMRDGGVYLDRLKGKKIKNYKYNEKTGNYEVEIE